ncbi:hypothetical protein [Actinomadura sediminis]|uniref:DUF3592 domain-containing protein n=1 Tax=Actinomadura sediminis TaxID=1038904 RepID=A0ABW3ENV4_9ACTN
MGGTATAGAIAGAIGVAVICVGTGSFLETRTFTRIECTSVAVKGGSVRHCTGESEEQARANDAARRDGARAALRAHRDGVPAAEPRRRTRLMFVDRDGRRVPQRVTASQMGGRWVAHSDALVGFGLLLAIPGGAVVLWGGWRVLRGGE